MYQFILRIVLFWIFFTSCNNKKEVVFTIDKESLVNIVIDIELAEVAAISTKGLVKDSLMKVYLEQISTRNEFSKKEIMANLVKLHKNPEYMFEVYRLAENKLNLLKKNNNYTK